MPSDGSENAWREPYIYFSADFKSERGVWEKLESHLPSRCGNYDSNWQKEFITLKPKQTSLYSESIFRINQYFTVKSSGMLRLVVHYDYGQGRHSREKEIVSS